MVARIVHGNIVNAELFPWHFNANILKTTFRFVGELVAFDPALSVFDDRQHEPLDFVAAASQPSGLPGPIVFGLKTAIVACFSQHAFLGSQQVDLASAVTLPTLELIELLCLVVSSLVGRWA